MSFYPRRIFESPVHAWVDQVVHAAATKAQDFPLDGIAEDEIDNLSKGIAAEVARFQVATLRKDEKQGKRRVEAVTGGDGFGDNRVVNASYIDVSVPFDGCAESFHIAPSRCHVIDEHVSVGDSAVVVSLVDDDYLENKLDSALRRIEENLNVLRSEIGGVSTSAANVVRTILAGRLREYNEQKRRDQSRSFPID